MKNIMIICALLTLQVKGSKGGEDSQTEAIFQPVMQVHEKMCTLRSELIGNMCVLVQTTTTPSEGLDPQRCEDWKNNLCKNAQEFEDACKQLERKEKDMLDSYCFVQTSSSMDSCAEDDSMASVLEKVTQGLQKHGRLEKEQKKHLDACMKCVKEDGDQRLLCSLYICYAREREGTMARFFSRFANALLEPYGPNIMQATSAIEGSTPFEYVVQWSKAMCNVRNRLMGEMAALLKDSETAQVFALSARSEYAEIYTEFIKNLCADVKIFQDCAEKLQLEEDRILDGLRRLAPEPEGAVKSEDLEPKGVVKSEDLEPKGAVKSEDLDSEGAVKLQGVVTKSLKKVVQSFSDHAFLEESQRKHIKHLSQYMNSEFAIFPTQQDLAKPFSQKNWQDKARKTARTSLKFYVHYASEREKDMAIFFSKFANALREENELSAEMAQGREWMNFCRFL
ncbi:MAG: hypothetical protein OXC30_03180 [Alphaproteobacteria bacterium]|nr:hypothetical protein [Alphaproteobacteria bacterium]